MCEMSMMQIMGIEQSGTKVNRKFRDVELEKNVASKLDRKKN